MDDKVQEVMNILQEECAEVIQAISKCRRFGLDNKKTDLSKSNVECLYACYQAAYK